MKNKMKNALCSNMSNVLRPGKVECGPHRMSTRRSLGEEVRKLTRSQIIVFCRPFSNDFDFYSEWYSGL